MIDPKKIEEWKALLAEMHRPAGLDPAALEAAVRAAWRLSLEAVPAFLAEREELIRERDEQASLAATLNAVAEGNAQYAHLGNDMLDKLRAEREELLAALAREGFSVVGRDRVEIVRPCSCTVGGRVCPAHREEALLAVLREVEWTGGETGGECPLCHGNMSMTPEDVERELLNVREEARESWRIHLLGGHAPDCRLAALLGKEGR